MKILHFAIENYARIPYNLVQAERKAGHESILVIPYKTKYYVGDEDYCLNLPFVGSGFITYLKKIFPYQKVSDSNLRNVRKNNDQHARTSNITTLLFQIRDFIWERKIRTFLKNIVIDSFNLIVLDGGGGFLRSGKIISELKQAGTKILITYCGSDFRSRGPLYAIENLADYRLTFEHDHSLLDPTLDFYFAPYSFPDYHTIKPHSDSTNIRIGHAPTNRLVKGTETILQILNEIKTHTTIEIILIENMSHKEALVLKESCHIFIDNIGEIGYGINSLESLYMGIPTAVQIMPDLEKLIPDHPFINVNKDTLKDRLIELIESESLRKKYSENGKQWLSKYHDAQTISQEILEKING